MSASLCMMANDALLCVAQNDADFSVRHDGMACDNAFERFGVRCASGTNSFAEDEEISCQSNFRRCVDANDGDANFHNNAFERFDARCAGTQNVRAKARKTDFCGNQTNEMKNKV